MKEMKTKTIGLIIDHLEESYQSLVWPGISDYARDNDLNLMMFICRSPQTPYGYNIHYNVVQGFISNNNIDGLIVMSGSMSDYLSTTDIKKYLNHFSTLPIITIGTPVADYPGVYIDNKKGIVESISHLIAHHNKKRIAFIRGPENNQEANERFEAYCEALDINGLPVNQKLITPPGGFDRPSGKIAIEILVDKRNEKFDALIAVDDVTAFGALEALQQRGFKIPFDVAVVGFDDIEDAKYHTPPLTTIRQPLYEQGREAARLMHELIRGEKIQQSTYLPTELVVRQSCGCISYILKQNETTRKSINLNVSDIEKIFKINRKSFYNDMFDILKVSESLEKHFITYNIDLLLDKLLSYLNNGGDTLDFLRTLNSAIVVISNNLNELVLWDKALQTLRTNTLKHFGDFNYVDKIEYLFHKVQILIDEVIQRVQAFYKMKLEEEVKRLQEVSQTLITTFDIEELMQVVAKEVPRLGIDQCFLALYEGEYNSANNNTCIPESSRAYLAYNEKGRYKIKKSDAIFDTKDIMPDNRLFSNKRFDLILMPLFFRNEQFGYIVFNIGKTEKIIYETLRRQISSALKGAILLKRRKEIEEELKMANEDLIQRTIQVEAANAAKSVFLANMSHEIRTPMNAILGFAELLDNEIKEEQHKQYLSAIRASGKTLLSLINDILDLSKIEANKMELYFSPINLRLILNEIKNIFLEKIKEKNLKLILEVDKDLPNGVLLDETRIRQILFNLIGNAIKFTEEGHIKVSMTSRYLKKNKSMVDLFISITDTGIGIASGQKEKIFESFMQQEGQNVTKYGGTGLGLSISKQLVEMMNGKISLESDYGQGSTFDITFKDVVVTPISNTADINNEITLDSIVFKKSKILVVDDVDNNRIVIRGYLKKYDIDIVEARDGSEALELASVHMPDIILMDVKMPVMDGYDATRLLKRGDRTKNIPVVFFTASAMKKDIEKIKAAGGDSYLWKPLIRKDLILELMRYLPHTIEGKEIEIEPPEQVIELEVATDDEVFETFDLSDTMISKIHGMIRELEEDYMKKWEKIQKTFFFDEIELFAEEICELGTRSDFEPIINWGQKLLKQARSFDMEVLPATLNSFPDKINEIKRNLEKSGVV